MANDHNNFLREYSNFLDTTGEHLSYAAISLYLNTADELSGKERRWFEKHLNACAACSARLHEVEDVENVDPSLKVYSFPPPALFRYAAAAMVTLAVGMGVYMFFGQPSRESIHPQNDLLVESQFEPRRLVPNPVLENFIERTVRSSSPVIISSPGIGDTVMVPFSIHWSGAAARERKFITVVDNQNNVVWKADTELQEITLDDPLTPGLYYIKLEMKQRLVRVGKVIVRQNQ